MKMKFKNEETSINASRHQWLVLLKNGEVICGFDKEAYTPDMVAGVAPSRVRAGHEGGVLTIEWWVHFQDTPPYEMANPADLLAALTRVEVVLTSQHHVNVVMHKMYGENKIFSLDAVPGKLVIDG